MLVKPSVCPRLPPQWLEWHPCAPVLLAGTADGNVWMWKIPGGDCKTFQGPGCQATCGKVLPDGESEEGRGGREGEGRRKGGREGTQRDRKSVV